jgi:phosphoribosylformylglycinamidine cyclo-ligase
MYRTFNYGIGMVLVVSDEETEDVMVRLSGLKEEPFLIGEIAKCGKDEEQVELI